jgi:outer membrane protein OmpA-like peptidoglycan-associated protein
LLEEFLLPGRWALEAAPATVDAQPENRSAPVEVRLRRVGNLAPVPAGVPASPVAPDSLQDRSPVSRRPVVPAQQVSAPPLAVIDLVRATAPDLEPDSRLDFERDVIGPYRVPVRFAWGSRRVPAPLLPVLDTLARRLLQSPDAVVEIQGHTDATGGHRANLRLSRARADEVRRLLLIRGVRREQIVTRGVGADRPLGDNRSAAGRALNRRVELRRAAPNDSVHVRRDH